MMYKLAKSTNNSEHNLSKAATQSSLSSASSSSLSSSFYNNPKELANNYSDDLNELNNLLDDLYNAKVQLANNTELTQVHIEQPTSPSYIIPSSSSSSASPIASSMSSSSSSSSSSTSCQSRNKLSNSRRSIEKLIDLIDDKNNSISIDRNSVNINKTNKAAKELEDLMASLLMYKKSDEEESVVVENYKNPLEETNREIQSIPINFINRSNSSDDTQTKPKIAYPFRNNNLCSGCDQPILGQVITALGSLWHPDHFCCYHCKKSIGANIFYEKDDRPYCEEDYLNLFSPKCSACTKPILDKMLTALEQSWHISCFVCVSCNKMLNDESFLEMNNNAYCKNCYINELAPKCRKCSNAIVENFISALGSYWHPACFVCTECGVPFNASSFYEHSNMPYCELHYHLKRGSLCQSCQQPINGRCITAMNKKFHPEHFTCSFCLKQLNKGTFKEQNEKPYCHPCFLKLFP